VLQAANFSVELLFLPLAPKQGRRVERAERAEKSQHASDTDPINVALDSRMTGCDGIELRAIAARTQPATKGPHSKHVGGGD